MERLKFILLFFLSLYGFQSGLSAQVATPNIDPMWESESPAAIGFKKQSAAGLRLVGYTGTEQINGSKTAEYDGAGNEYLLATSFNPYAFEFVYLPGRKIERSTSGVSTESELTRMQIGGAWLASPELSVGVVWENWVLKNKTTKTETEENRVGGGFSWEFNKKMYLAAAAYRIQNQGTYIIENRWLELNAGLAGLWGTEENPLRVEINWIQSPEDLKSGEGILQNNYHRQTTEQNIVVEWVPNEFLFRFHAQSKSEKAIESTDEEILTRGQSLGLAYYFNSKNALLGYYITTTLAVEGDKEIQEFENRIHLSFAF